MNVARRRKSLIEGGIGYAVEASMECAGNERKH